MRLKISKNKHPFWICDWGSVWLPDSNWGYQVWQNSHKCVCLCCVRKSHLEQSHPNAFFKLCLNRTCNCIPCHVFTVPLMILVTLEILSSVAIFFLEHNIRIKQENLLPGNLTFSGSKNCPPPFFFGNSNKWSQVEVKAKLSNLDCHVFSFLKNNNLFFNLSFYF